MENITQEVEVTEVVENEEAIEEVKTQEPFWINFKVNKQNIDGETTASLLIKFPNNSGLKDFKFWVSKKCVRSGSHGYELVVGLRSDFQIKAQRTSPRNWKKVLDEKVMTAQEVADRFQNRA